MGGRWLVAPEDHRSMPRWAGGHFDPEWFDLDLINTDVERAPHANLKRRARQPKPRIAKGV